MNDLLSFRPVARRFLLLVLLGTWCAGLLLFRFLFSGSLNYSFLAWNLFLAALPLLLAPCVAWSCATRRPLLSLGLFALWLALLPNAPYIVTDFVHLHGRAPVPLWFDIALLASFAGTGLLFGYASLVDVQIAITKRFSVWAGWAVAAGALLLCGFGIYLGRFLRWNSWDAVTNPAALFLDIGGGIIQPFSHPRAAAVSVIYGLMLCLGYAALRLLEPGSPRPISGRAADRPS